ncbi:hypothetical protein [Bradyrhizobium sp. SZCCHNPS2010]|uniref:hypothetical protein n=1 Tax=Bradyrhizobium sp. SZCCHNPS2010 TaxID=3057333 RepID=UPI002916EC91|nr:hypothetical protein [Bradyrhizobium sp. SZCCHNPS2010]
MSTTDRRNAALAGLSIFAPSLRISALESKRFRDAVGLSVDAVVQFDELGVAFQRSALFKNVRGLLSGSIANTRIVDQDNQSWNLSLDKEKDRIRITAGDRTHLIPDFSYLHAEVDKRLVWFDAETKRHGINDDELIAWRQILSDREIDDEEVDGLLKQFRLTPRYVAAGIERSLRRKAIQIDTLVPDEVTYFDRLVGKPGPEDDLQQFLESTIKGRPELDLPTAFLLSSHSFGPQNIALEGFDSGKVLEFFEWAEHAGDRFTQVGLVECGLRHLEKMPQLASHIRSIIETIRSDDPDSEASRLELLCALITLVDGELARTGICRDRQPFWRRLAAIAHASVIERAIVSVNMLPDDFIVWCRQSRGLQFYLQSFVDMRKEPRWNPDLLSALQLKAEFIGRIVAAAPSNVGVVLGNGSEDLFDRGSPSSLIAQVSFPYSFLPGPLEGATQPIAIMPPEIENNLNEMLRSEPLTAKSFVTLVNCALLYPLDGEFARLAAEGLARAKYELPNIKSSDEAFHLLVGLAIVASVTRSAELANEVRILMRAVRRKPDIQIDQENAFRICLLAASAFAELSNWARYIGDFATELSFEDMSRESISTVWNFIEVLRQLEPALWQTTARADAALEAAFTCCPPENLPIEAG